METLRYILLVNGLLVVVSIAYYVLLRRETFFSANRLALWMGLVAALILPLLELPDWRPQPVRAVMQRTAQVIVPRVLANSQSSQSDVTITFPNHRTYQAFQIQQNQFVWSWQQVLISFYSLIVFVLLARFGRQLFSLQHLIKQSIHESYHDFTLVRNASVTSPFSFFNWVVLNPEHHTAGELEQILRHERVHVRERHSLDMIGAECVCIIFWFNPAAYLFRYLLHQTLEFRADHAVLTEGIDAKLYQYNLLKVSLSAGQSAITNHFSKSQLKSRIAMLNRQKSSKATWLKYPVVFFAALTMASAFAHPHPMKILSKYVPISIPETILSVTEPTKDDRPLPKKATQQANHRPAELDINRNNKQELPIQQVSFQLDSTNHRSLKNANPVSPSHYMVYEGDYLYWIITSKTTIDDFAVMKQEFARYGYQLQLNELKYDPLDIFIDGIMYRTWFKANLSTPTSNIIFQGETDNVLTPISTIAGYIGVKNNQLGETGSSRLNGRYSKTTSLYQTTVEEKFPDILRQVAADDEATVSQSINDRKMDYLVLAGERKYGHLGIGFRKFNQKEIKKEASHGGFISVNPDGSLSVDKAKSFTKVYINNELVPHEDIQRIKINQLYTMAVILGYDESTQKRTGTEYLLFYVN